MGRKVWKRKKGADLNTKLNNQTYKDSMFECYFRGLEDHLIDYIQESHSVVCCVAWLTSQNILKVLVNRPSILVLRNESWLNKKGQLAKATRELYSTLRSSKVKLPGIKKTQDVLVCGAISHPQNMHHKFIVRLDDTGKAISVWTGSYNPTNNGNESLENAVVIHNEQVADTYLQEFLQVHKISKSLKC